MSDCQNKKGRDKVSKGGSNESMEVPGGGTTFFPGFLSIDAMGALALALGVLIGAFPKGRCLPQASDFL